MSIFKLATYTKNKTINNQKTEKRDKIDWSCKASFYYHLIYNSYQVPCEVLSK